MVEININNLNPNTIISKLDTHRENIQFFSPSVFCLKNEALKKTWAIHIHTHSLYMVLIANPIILFEQFWI